MYSLIAAAMISALGPIVPQNTLKVAVETAVKQAAAYTDTKARSKDDLVVYEPMNEHWVWTSDDPNCPGDFLPMANRYGSPKPKCMKDAYGHYHWAHAVFYDTDGSRKYSCYIKGGSPTDLKVTFQFSIESKSGDPAFSATATRESATSTKMVPVNGDLKIAIAGKPVRSYASKKRLNTYLYEFQFDTYDIEEAKAYFEKEYVPPVETAKSQQPLMKNYHKLGGCSGLRNGNFVGRNFDWMYDEDITVVIRVPADETIGRQASVGVAYVAGLSDEVCKSEFDDELYKLMPFRTVDGINDSGVYIQDNVCPPGDYGYTTSTSTNAKHRVPAMLAVRYVLDYATNAVHACELIKNDLDMYGFYTATVKDEIHFLIADTDHTFIVETISNKVEVIDASERPIITNFHIWNSQLKDGEIDRDTLTAHPNGIERYNILYSNRSNATTLEGMMNTMKMVEYTKTYSSDPFWYSEIYGDNVTKDTPVEEYAELISLMKESFVMRDRKKPYKEFIWTWQTCHTSVYDLEHRMLWLVDQERDSSTGSYFLLHPERVNPINN